MFFIYPAELLWVGFPAIPRLGAFISLLTTVVAPVRLIVIRVVFNIGPPGSGPHRGPLSTVGCPRLCWHARVPIPVALRGDPYPAWLNQFIPIRIEHRCGSLPTSPGPSTSANTTGRSGSSALGRSPFGGPLTARLAFWPCPAHGHPRRRRVGRAFASPSRRPSAFPAAALVTPRDLHPKTTPPKQRSATASAHRASHPTAALASSACRSPFLSFAAICSAAVSPFAAHLSAAASTPAAEAGLTVGAICGEATQAGPLPLARPRVEEAPPAATAATSAATATMALPRQRAVEQ